MSLAEPRAKRTHARRSCDLCKVRKTRCELPDLDIPSSSDPLPMDKACHRCRVLALPCVVDDSGRKNKKRQREDGDAMPGDGMTLASASQQQAGPSKQRRQSRPRASAASSLGGPGATTLNGAMGEEFDFELMHGFEPLEPTLANISNLPPPGPFAAAAAPDQQSPAAGGAGAGDNAQARSMKLHGRPLSLTCEMLQVAYGKEPFRKKRARLEVDDVDLITLVDEALRRRLEPAAHQLRTFHAYLESLPSLFTNYECDRSVSNALVLATVLYLASLSLHADGTITRIRSTLGSYIGSLRDRLILTYPSSFVAIQALELLAVHAPLGVLPLQLTNLRTLDVARGQIACAQSLSIILNFRGLIQTLTAAMSLGIQAGHPDYWLYLSLIAAQASLALEDEVPRKPAALSEMHPMADRMLSPDQAELWHGWAEDDAAATIGRLGVCDRLLRLSEVLDAVGRIRYALEQAATDASFDPVQATVEEMQIFASRMEALDQRHDGLLSLVSPLTQGYETGWAAHRRIRRRYEANRVHVVGLRALIATAYIPGHPLAFQGLATHVTSTTAKVTYAIDRASNPADIVPFLLHASPAVQAVWQWGKHRGDICEQILVALSELVPTLVPGASARVDLVPLHEVISMALEAAKVLMEMQSGKALLAKATNQPDDSLRAASFLHMIRQVSAAMRMLGGMALADEDGGESVPIGCANVVGSMLRMADEWARGLDESKSAGGGGVPSGPTTGTEGTPVANPNPGGEQSVAYTGNGSSSHPPQQQHQSASESAVTNGGQGQDQQQHGYMQSSDRWMAGGSHPSHNPHDQAPPSQPYPPTPLDVLLSQMFNYSYQGQNQQQQHQHASGGTGHEMQMPLPPPMGQGHEMKLPGGQGGEDRGYGHAGQGAGQQQQGGMGWQGGMGPPRTQ